MRRAIEIRRRQGQGVIDRVSLSYAERVIARQVLTVGRGERFLVESPEAVRVHDGDAFLLDDDRLVAVDAAVEPLDEVRGGDFYHLTRLAWQLGARGVPVQIEPFRLLVPREPSIERMLKAAGASLTPVRESFRPEGDDDASPLCDWHLAPRG